MLVDGSLNPPPTPSLYPHPQHITTPPQFCCLSPLPLLSDTPVGRDSPICGGEGGGAWQPVWSSGYPGPDQLFTDGLGT